MKRTGSFFLSMLAALSLQAQETYLSTDFNRGIPDDFLNIDVDELPVNSGFNFAVSGDWFTNTIYGAEGKAAVSTSRHEFDIPASNWLITPPINVKSADAVFTWDAKSVHYDLRDGYRVLISTTDNDPESFTELFSVDTESYTWQHHILSLADYAGQTVYLAIEHNSTKKFLLAIDNIYVGVPGKLTFDAENNTPHFCGNTGTTLVSGKIRNTGKKAEIAKIICTSGLNVFTQELNQTVKTNDQLDFSFEVPVTLNETVPYQIDVVTADGETANALTDEVICSYFPRTLLVEKGTGVWCTACPALMGYMNELKEEFKDEVVLIESHSAFNDRYGLSFAPYDYGMATSNYPVLYFNRDHSFQAGSKESANEALKELITAPTPALVTAKAYYKDGKIAIAANMKFGKDIDNSKGQYRIGFAVLQKHIQMERPVQKSAISGSQYQEYGMMRSPFAPDLFFLHNTVRGDQSCFDGIPKSLPADIKAGGSYDYEGTIEIPEVLKNEKDITVVAIVFDFFNKRAMNVTEITVGDEDATGIENVAQESLKADVRINGNECRISLPQSAAYSVAVHDLGGRLISNTQGNGAAALIKLPATGKTAYLVTVKQGNQQLTQKVMAE